MKMEEGKQEDRFKVVPGSDGRKVIIPSLFKRTVKKEEEEEIVPVEEEEDDEKDEGSDFDLGDEDFEDSDVQDQPDEDVSTPLHNEKKKKTRRKRGGVGKSKVQKVGGRARAGKEGLKCDLCEGTFKSKLERRRHKKTAHPPKLTIDNNNKDNEDGVQCDHCEKRFKDQRRLKCHFKKIHKKALLLACPQCPYKNAKLRTLRSHMLVVHLVDDYQPPEDDVVLREGDHVKPVDDQLQCPSCERTFGNAQGLRLHLTRVHHQTSRLQPETARPQCRHCGKSFKERWNLQVHLGNVHGPDEQLPCGTCGKKFRNQRYLQQHAWSVHEEKLVVKGPVTFVSGDGTSLAKPIRDDKHSSDPRGVIKTVIGGGQDPIVPELAKEEEEKSQEAQRPVKELPKLETGRSPLDQQQEQSSSSLLCPTCGKSLKNLDILKNHLRKVHQKDEKCPHCDYRTSMQYMPDHVRTYHLKGSYVCQECGKVFKMEHYLQRHIRKTHNPKCSKEIQQASDNSSTSSLPCYGCDQTFHNHRDLFIHIRKVHKANHHKCRRCDDFAGTNYELRVHERKVHSSLRQSVCHHCARAFFKESDVKEHIRRVHEKEVPGEEQCQDCGEMFVKKSLLVRHMFLKHLVTRMKCSQCETVLKSHVSMNIHTRNMHGGQREVCEQCGKSFRTEPALRIHVGRFHGGKGDGEIVTTSGRQQQRQQSVTVSQDGDHERKEEAKEGVNIHGEKGDGEIVMISGQQQQSGTVSQEVMIGGHERIEEAKKGVNIQEELDECRVKIATHTTEKEQMILSGKQGSATASHEERRKEPEDVREELDHDMGQTELIQERTVQVKKEEKEHTVKVEYEAVGRDCENTTKEKVEQDVDMESDEDGADLPGGNDDDGGFSDDEGGGGGAEEVGKEVQDLVVTKGDADLVDDVKAEELSEEDVDDLELGDEDFVDTSDDEERGEEEEQLGGGDFYSDSDLDEEDSSDSTYGDKKRRRKNVNNDKAHACKVCERVLKTASSLKRHTMQVHPEKPVQCDQCDIVLKNAMTLSYHVKNFHDPKVTDEERTCQVCKKVLRTARTLRTHTMQVHSAEQPVKCDQYDVVLKHATSLREHVRDYHVPDVKDEDQHHSCEACKKVFKSARNLRSHMRYVHPTKQVKCDQCDAVKRNVGELRHHVRSHHTKDEEQHVTCEVCKKVLKFGTLRSHMRHVHSEEKPVKCGQCPAVLKHAKSLRDHVQICHDPKVKNSCEVCKKVFRRARNLRTHMRRVHPTEEVQSDVTHACKVCGKVFKYAGNLRHHARHAHVEEPPVKCGQCDATLKHSFALKLHMKRSHNPDKPVRSEQDVVPSDEPQVCPICGKVLKPKGLERHMRNSHSEEKRVKCPECDEEFTGTGYLKMHLGWVHGKSNNFVCHLCGNRYGKPRNLRIHIRKMHGKQQRAGTELNDMESEVVCQICGKLLKRKGLERHMRNFHSEEKRTALTCPECGKEFTGERNLQTHIAVVHENIKAFVCHLCGDRFGMARNLRVHLRRHHGKQLPGTSDKDMEDIDAPEGPEMESEVICQICGKLLKPKGLERHMRNSHSEEKRVKCPECDKEFTGAGYLKQHINWVHGKSNNFVCHLCGYRYGKARNLSIHIRTQHGKQPAVRDIRAPEGPETESEVVCQICGKLLKREQLQMHMTNFHTEGEQVMMKCPKCDKEFRHEDSLQKHITVVHDKIKPFVCDFCGHRCGNKSGLKVHIENHHGEQQREPVVLDPKTGKRTFPCKICGEVCASSSWLGRHMNEKHREVDDDVATAGKTSFACEKCGVKYSRRGGLTQHLLIKHGIDTYKFKSKIMIKGLNDATTDAVPPCEKCGEQYETKDALARHISARHGYIEWRRKRREKKMNMINSTAGGSNDLGTGEDEGEKNMAVSSILSEKSLFWP